MLEVKSEMVRRKVTIEGGQDECSKLAFWLEKALEHDANELADDDCEINQIMEMFTMVSGLADHYYPTQNTVTRLIDMLRGHMG